MVFYRILWIFFWYFRNGTLAHTDYFCRNLVPQPTILIDQLMGIWYAIEIINHDSDRHYVRQVPSCPIIHISEDRSYSSLYKDYNNYNYNYGSRSYNPYDQTTPFYPRDTYSQDPYNRDRQYDRDPYRRTSPYSNDPYNRNPFNREQYNREQYNRAQYDRDRLLNKAHQDPYAREAPNFYPNRKYHTDRYPPVGYGRKFYDEIKRLRLLWDENGVSTEYRIRLNVSMPGFWISSGPENGSSLDPQVGHFAGTVQVLKVVGNHMVLNFCHQQPDKSYFTVILSRSISLSHYDISGVHGLLHRKGLDTNNIKKVCNGGIENILNQIFLLLTIGIVFCR
ncbi:hypothetical protein WA026_000777 [Henosepilachna vigintioctopunctata]|uniref:Uncharacterized protein n=1 Tax=Henosepilachna vigintioctopunctata TaxID=420089 RepID=A0AAW1V8A2_9CUCU